MFGTPDEDITVEERGHIEFANGDMASPVCDVCLREMFNTTDTEYGPFVCETCDDEAEAEEEDEEKNHIQPTIAKAKEEIFTKFDLSNISRPGDALKAIQAAKEKK
jgi:DNA-directed RNA polymerase subunit M/transcription elongation factor TFIIS